MRYDRERERMIYDPTDLFSLFILSDILAHYLYTILRRHFFDQHNTSIF